MYSKVKSAFCLLCCFLSPLFLKAESDTLTQTVYGNPSFEFNMSESSIRTAVGNAIKVAITKEVAAIKKEKAGNTGSVSVNKISPQGANFVLLKSGTPIARVKITVDGSKIVSNDGVFPPVRKTVKFNLKSADRTFPGYRIQSEVAYNFMMKNKACFDCVGSHEHGHGSGTRRYCKDIVDTVRKVVEIDLTIEIEDIK